MASQLEIQQAINKAISARTTMLAQQTTLIKSQIADVLGLKKAWEDVDPQINDVLSTIKNAQEALNSTSDSFDRLGNSGLNTSTKLSNQLNKTNKVSEVLKFTVKSLAADFPILGATAASFVSGLKSGFEYVYEILSSTLSLTKTIGKGFIDVGLSIAQIPVKTLDSLIQLSNKLIPMMEAVARATEDVRKQFGDLSTTASAAILETAKNVGTGFEKIGLSGYSIFGSLDERMQAVNKLATAMGASFDNFSDEIIKSNGAVMLLQKGLGLADEEMSALASRARAMGQTITTQLRSITDVVAGKNGLSAKFGISQKLISRDIGQMLSSVKNFGNLSVKELGKTSVYARKLNVEFKELLGVVDKFDTFESAAEASAMLSQAFGANTDAIKLMKAENPADRVEELRNAFLSTGKSADLLTRQEIKLLAQTTGLSEETARVAFSQKNMGVSMAALEKQGKIATEQHMSTAEAVQAVQASIERVIKPFRQFSSFIEAMADGFARGIFGAESFRNMLTTIHEALRLTYQTGMNVGKKFFEIFPGIKQFSEGLTKLFSVEGKFTSFSRMLSKIEASFTKFFSSVTGPNGSKAVKKLIEDLGNSFKEIFGVFNGTAIENSSKQFLSATGNIVAGMISTFSSGVVEILKILTSLISGEDLPNIPGGKLGKAFIDPIKKEFEDPNGAITKIGPAFVKLFDTLWEKYGDDIKAALLPVGAGIAGVIFGAAFIQAAVGTLIAGLHGFFATKLTEWLLVRGAGAIGGAAAGLGAKIAAVLTSPFLVIPALIAAAIGSGVGISNGIEKFNSKLSEKFKTTEALIGSAAAGLADALTFGLMPDGLAEQFGIFFASLSEKIFSTVRKFPLGDIFADVWSYVLEDTIKTFASFGDLIKTIFTGNSDDITVAATKFGDALLDGISAAFTGLVALMPTLMGLVGAALYQAFRGLGWIIFQAAPWLAKQVVTVFQIIGGVITGLLKNLAKKTKDIPILGGIVEGLAFAAEAITWQLKQIVDWLATTIKAWGSFSISDFLDAIILDVKSFANDIWNKFGGTFTKIFDFVSNIFGGFIDVVKSFGTKIFEVFTSVVSSIKDILGISSFTEIGKQMVNGILSGLSSLNEKVTTKFSEVVSSIKGVFGIRSPSTVTRSIGENIVAGMKQGLSGTENVFANATNSGINAIVDGLKSFKSSSIDIKDTSFKKISEALDVISNSQINANQIKATIESLQMLNKLSETADSILPKITTTLFSNQLIPDFEATKAPIVLAIKKMVDEVNIIEDALDSLRMPIDIDAKLEKLGKNLGLQDKEFKIERKNLQVNVNLKVVLEVDKLASALAEHDFVMSEKL